MLEKYLEQRCCKEVKKVGGIAIKLNPIGFSGIPDRLMLLPGAKVMFVEFKQPGKRPTIVQYAWLEKLSKLGFDARWCDDAGYFQEWLDGVLKPPGWI